MCCGDRQSSKSFSSASVRSDALLARNVVKHAVNVHVLVGGQLAVETWILENDAEPLPHFGLLVRGIQPVDAHRSAGRAAAASSAF